MTNKPSADTCLGGPTRYEIRVKGHLGRAWARWFGDLTLTLEDNGDALLTGAVADQAALHGLLKKVRDLGMPLISVHSVEPDRAGAPKEETMGLSKQTREIDDSKAILSPR